MATKKDETASFVLRFTQKIYQNEQNEPQIQWRGNMRHVQSGDEKNFSKFDEVIQFIQSNLTDLTVQAVEHKTPEEQKGILSKSFDLWKRMTIETPKLVLDTLKDPKKQAHLIQEQIQEQIQERMHQVGDAFNQKLDDVKEKLEVDEWRGSSKSDYKNIMKMLEQMSSEIQSLNEKVEKLSKKGK
jgi:hypothetical protein